MFWNIFLSSLVLIVAIMVIGQLIASFVERNDSDEASATSESEE